MIPVSPVLSEEFKDKEVVYAKDQAQYKPLPVLRNPDGVLLSRWQLSDWERAAIAAGADLYLYNWTFNQPLQPVMMEIGDVQRDAVDRAAFMGMIEAPVEVG